MLIELRVGARSRDGSHVDNEIDSGFLQQIGKFDDRPGRVAYGEKGVRHVSNGQPHRADRKRVISNIKSADCQRPVAISAK
jgi:hypothetical protein